MRYGSLEHPGTIGKFRELHYRNTSPAWSDSLPTYRGATLTMLGGRDSCERKAKTQIFSRSG